MSHCDAFAGRTRRIVDPRDSAGSLANEARMAMSIEGGCFCGALRYAMEPGDYLTANCHCTMCRRVHAAPFVTWLVVPAERFAYTKGTATAFASSPDGTRYFCSRCGTQVACINATHPEIVDVALGSLDAPQAFSPTMDVFTDTQLPWVHGAMQPGRT